MKAWQTYQKMSDMFSKEKHIKRLLLNQETGELISSDTAAYLLKKQLHHKTRTRNRSSAAKHRLCLMAFVLGDDITYNQHVVSECRQRQRSPGKDIPGLIGLKFKSRPHPVRMLQIQSSKSQNSFCLCPLRS